MIKLETRHLRLVVAIADYGSLTRASNQLHLTQSALSHQLSDLEAQLGVRLFERLGKRMEPTLAAERLNRMDAGILLPRPILCATWKVRTSLFPMVM